MFEGRLFAGPGATVDPVQVEIHPDPRCQRLVELRRESETVQALDRLRLLRRDTAAKVYVLSNIPCDFEVDELVERAKLLGDDDKVDFLMIALGVMPLGGAHLYKMVSIWGPDYWPSENAASCWLKRVKSKGVDLALRTMCVDDPLSTVSYRLKGQSGSDCRALVDARVKDVKALIERALGAEVVKLTFPPVTAPAPTALAVTCPTVAPAELFKA